MDFDTAKENIQPLRHGRRADRLEAALSEQSKDSLEHEKKWDSIILNPENSSFWSWSFHKIVFLLNFS